MTLPDPPLLVISDRGQARRPLIEVAEAVFAGGVRWFSLREKDLPPAERRCLLARLVELGHRHGAVVSVHEDVEAVIAVGADGVHLPSGGDPRAARARLHASIDRRVRPFRCRSCRAVDRRSRLRHRQPDFSNREQTRLWPGAWPRRSRPHCRGRTRPGAGVGWHQCRKCRDVPRRRRRRHRCHGRGYARR